MYLPSGPTAYFKLTSIALSKSISVHAFRLTVFKVACLTINCRAMQEPRPVRSAEVNKSLRVVRGVDRGVDRESQRLEAGASAHEREEAVQGDLRRHREAVLDA